MPALAVAQSTGVNPWRGLLLAPEQRQSTAEHDKYDILKQRFRDPQEVTTACISCHTRAASQIHLTKHWTWSFDNPRTGQKLGKLHVLNNTYMAVEGNLENCTLCHIGNGWVDDTFDQAAPQNVDCLICHDTTGEYYFEKFHAGRADCEVCHDGRPRFDRARMAQRKTLEQFAQAVGPTTRATCGACHFRSDGGDGVKHGDLDTSLTTPDRALDVHMDAEGLNFTCATCHTTDQHVVTGSRYVTQALDRLGVDVPGHTDLTRASCESCHGLKPHPQDNHPKLNDHTDRVACPTCHIPSFARGGRKTVTDWDWSTAGETGPNNQAVTRQEDGYTTYSSLRGDWRWAENVVPEYRWFNGNTRFTLPGDPTINPAAGPVDINGIEGSADDPESRIWPFKVLRGKQPYDAAKNIFAFPHFASADDSGYWRNFDWTAALEKGMADRGLEFSGEVAFVETAFYWPILHMVAPKAEALACNECHVSGGRLAELEGFYMPGRDYFPWLSWIGWAAAALTAAGMALHLLLRVFFSVRHRNNGNGRV